MNDREGSILEIAILRKAAESLPKISQKSIVGLLNFWEQSVLKSAKTIEALQEENRRLREDWKDAMIIVKRLNGVMETLGKFIGDKALTDKEIMFCKCAGINYPTKICPTCGKRKKPPKKKE